MSTTTQKNPDVAGGNEARSLQRATWMLAAGCLITTGYSLHHIYNIHNTPVAVEVNAIAADGTEQDTEPEPEPEPEPESKPERLKSETPKLPPTDDNSPSKGELTSIQDLFSLRFPEVLATGELGPTVHVAKLAGPRSVRIINFWATWCEPCKREFAEFKAMSKRDAWGSEVRFIPMVTDEEYKKAGRMIKRMPSGSRQLSTQAEFIKEALWGEGILPRGQKLILPLTLVVDCHDKIVFSVPGGALNPSTSSELAEVVGESRKKLGSCPREQNVTCPPGSRPNTEGGCDRKGKLPDLGI